MPVSIMSLLKVSSTDDQLVTAFLDYCNLLFDLVLFLHTKNARC